MENKIKKVVKTFQENKLKKYTETIDFTYKMGAFFNARIFQQQWKAPLKNFVFAMEHMRALGSYKSKTPIGFSNLITLNIIVLNNKTLLSAVLLHEMIHQYEDMYDPRPTKTGYYHDVRFRELSESYIPVCNKGRFRGVTEKFIELLIESKLLSSDEIDRRLLIDSDILKELLLKPKSRALKKIQDAEKPKTKLKKWSCGCPRPINVRCAVKLDATCNICGQRFEEQ